MDYSLLAIVLLHVRCTLSGNKANWALSLGLLLFFYSTAPSLTFFCLSTIETVLAENTQDKEDNRRTGRRVRRQIGSWNPQPMLNRLFSNATGLFENLGRQMSRQLQNLEGAGRAASGAFQSVQENFKRFAKSVNLNISQLRPERLFSQLASLTRA